MILYYKNNNDDKHLIVTQKITMQEAVNNCLFIKISDSDKDLINRVAQVSSIRDAIDKGRLESFSTDIVKKLDNDKLSNSLVIDEISTTYNAVYIGYNKEGHHIYLARFKNGSIQKTVSKNKHKPFKAYLNTDNTNFELAY